MSTAESTSARKGSPSKSCCPGTMRISPSLREDMRVGDVERQLVVPLIGRADRRPDAIAVGQAGRADARVDRRVLVGDAGAHGQLVVQLVVEAEGVEIAVVVVERQIRDHAAAGSDDERRLQNAPVRPLEAGMHGQSGREGVRNADGDLVRRGQVGGDRNLRGDGSENARRSCNGSLELVVDPRAVADTDRGADERRQGDTGREAEAGVVAVENDARGARRDAGGALETDVEILQRRTGRDRQPIVDLDAEDGVHVHREDPGRTRIELARPGFARIRHEAVGRGGRQTDPEHVVELVGIVAGREDGILTDVAGAAEREGRDGGQRVDVDPRDDQRGMALAPNARHHRDDGRVPEHRGQIARTGRGTGEGISLSRGALLTEGEATGLRAALRGDERCKGDRSQGQRTREMTHGGFPALMLLVRENPALAAMCQCLILAAISSLGSGEALKLSKSQASLLCST